MATRRRVWLPRNPLLALWTPRGTTGTMAPDRGLSPGSAPPAPGQSPPAVPSPGSRTLFLGCWALIPPKTPNRISTASGGARPARPGGTGPAGPPPPPRAPTLDLGVSLLQLEPAGGRVGPGRPGFGVCPPHCPPPQGPTRGQATGLLLGPRQAHRHPGPGPGHLAGRAAGFQPISRLQGQGWSHGSSQPCQSGLDLGSESQPAPLGSHPPVHPAPQGDVAGLSEQQALAGPWPPPQGQTWAVGERPRSLLPEGEGLAPRPPGGAGEGSRGSSSSWPGPRLWQP